MVPLKLACSSWVLLEARVPVAATLRTVVLACHVAVYAFIFLPNKRFFITLLCSTISIPAFPLLFSFYSPQFFLASHFTFLLCRELCVVSYLPPVAFKVFLSAKHPIHCHRNRKLSVEEKEEKKSGSLKLCNSVILLKSINGNMLGDMQKPAHCRNKRRKGLPFLGNFHRFSTLVETRRESRLVQKESVSLSHGSSQLSLGKLDKTTFCYQFCILKAAAPRTRP